AALPVLPPHRPRARPRTTRRPHQGRRLHARDQQPAHRRRVRPPPPRLPRPRPGGPMTTPTTNDLDAAISARLRAPDYRRWRAAVEATGGCAAPIRLRGTTTILDRDGQVLIERSGDVLAPCGNRRETVCPACSDRYAADAFHLL